MLSTEIKLYDNSRMFDVLAGFGDQIEEAFGIGESINSNEIPAFAGITNGIICGMGGSAIGGDLLRSYLLYDSKIPISINRNYSLPRFADSNTLAIISSYSGDTEETLSCYEEAEKRNCKIVCLSSGGKLSFIARSKNNLLISVPKGYQPRCAIAYSFFPLLVLVKKMGLIDESSPSPPSKGEIGSIIKSVRKLVQTRAESYTKLDEKENQAMRIANLIKGRIPVVYSSSDILDVVNQRWRNQLEENAKTVAYGNFLPEMNHNEIVGWETNPELLKHFAVISLTDPDDHPRIRKRNQVTIDLISNLAGVMMELDGEGATLLERIFDLIYLGDWVSFYLAILNKVDPTPVEKIKYLKAKLGEE
jgi:glucose/mannose-6-phosphate isomerase